MRSLSSPKRILFGESLLYDGVFRVGSHHYAKKFADLGWEVLWVSKPWHLGNLVKSAESLRQKISLAAGAQPVAPNIKGLAPFTLVPHRNLPLLRSRWAARNSLRFTAPFLKILLKSCHFDRVDILWITNVGMAPLLSMVEHKVSVYRMADDVTGFPGAPSSCAAVEEQLMSKVDIVFTTARVLFEKAKAMGFAPTLLRNGVEFEHFVKSPKVPLDPELHSKLEHISRPRAVYVGALRDWFDSELLRSAASECRDWKFVLVGAGDSAVISSFDHSSNIHFLGPCSYQQIPTLLTLMDVALIPFKVNSLTKATCPIKLFEYMSVGLPVVSTGLPEVAEFSDLVYLVETPQDSARALQQAMTEDREALRKARIECARENSWSSRFQTVVKTLAQYDVFVRQEG